MGAQRLQGPCFILLPHDERDVATAASIRDHADGNIFQSLNNQCLEAHIPPLQIPDNADNHHLFLNKYRSIRFQPGDNLLQVFRVVDRNGNPDIGCRYHIDRRFVERESIEHMAQELMGRKLVYRLDLDISYVIFGCHRLDPSFLCGVGDERPRSRRFERVQQTNRNIAFLGRADATRMENLGPEMCQLRRLLEVQLTDR